MTRVGVGAEWGASDAGFPRSDLRRGTEGGIGNVGCVCRDTKGGKGGVEMSVD